MTEDSKLPSFESSHSLSYLSTCIHCSKFGSSDLNVPTTRMVLKYKQRRSNRRTRHRQRRGNDVRFVLTATAAVLLLQIATCWNNGIIFCHAFQNPIIGAVHHAKTTTISTPITKAPIMITRDWNVPSYKGIPLTSSASGSIMDGNNNHDEKDDDNVDPMASQESLEALVPRSQIVPLIQSKSNLEGFRQLLWHASMLALAFTGFSLLNSKLVGALWLAFGSSFYFCGLHECVHRTAFKSKRWNDLWAHVFGILCLRPARHYRYYHWAHHKFTGDVERDSELQSGSFLDFPVTSLGAYLFYLTGIPFWIDAVTTTVQHAMGKCPEPYLPTETSRREVTREARIYLGLYGVVLGIMVAGCSSLVSSQLVVATKTRIWRCWILPALLGQPMLRFYLLAEHRGRTSTPNNICDNTRTMYDTNWFYRKMAWSMPYHMEHHAWPSVPFHQLEKAHKLLVEAAPPDFFQRGEHVLEPRQHYGYLQFHKSFIKTLLRNDKATATH